MIEITTKQIKSKILEFLANLKVEKKDDTDKFSFDVWFKENIGNAKLIQTATHISKAIHPDCKGDNVVFNAERKLPEGIVGSQILQNNDLDIRGTAGALQLGKLFNIKLDNNISLKDLILNNHPALTNAFSNDEEESKEYLAILKQTIEKTLIITKPFSDEFNKQILWPCGDNSIKEDNYKCLIPLYPSLLRLYLKNDIDDKHNSNLRKNKDKEKQSYYSMLGMAQTKMGGSNPQNISLMFSQGRGICYLLPSTPLTIKSEDIYFFKNSETIFSNKLRYICKEQLRTLLKSYLNKRESHHKKNNVNEKVGLVATTVLLFMQKLSQEIKNGNNYPNLNSNEKQWLQGNHEEDIKKYISKHFSIWLDKYLSDKKKDKLENNEDAHEWRMIMESIMLGKKDNE